jgi:TFIIF-interacting CTD phosphatase-like protein
MIHLRPHLIEFLEEMSQKYHMVLWTAGQVDYADTILRYFDPSDKYFDLKLYRKSCIMTKSRVGFKKDCFNLLGFDQRHSRFWWRGSAR